jgi:hypothetical protein
MSEVEIISEPNTTERDRGGRFVIGGKPGPGRPRGARSRLGEAFLEDLRDAWNEHGATALAACAINEPSSFCKLVASLLPRDINVNVAVDPQGFVEKFRAAIAMLGNEAPQRQRKSLPGRVIQS